MTKTEQHNAETLIRAGLKFDEARVLVLQAAGLMADALELCAGMRRPNGKAKAIHESVRTSATMASVTLMGLHDVVLHPENEHPLPESQAAE